MHQHLDRLFMDERPRFLLQARISRIESGDTDLKVSTLFRLARAFGLDPVLVPRRKMPTVKAIIRNALPEMISARDPAWRKFMRQAQDSVSGDFTWIDYAQIRASLRDLDRLGSFVDGNFATMIDRRTLDAWLLRATVAFSPAVPSLPFIAEWILATSPATEDTCRDRSTGIACRIADR